MHFIRLQGSASKLLPCLRTLHMRTSLLRFCSANNRTVSQAKKVLAGDPKYHFQNLKDLFLNLDRNERLNLQEKFEGDLSKEFIESSQKNLMRIIEKRDCYESATSLVTISLFGTSFFERSPEVLAAFDSLVSETNFSTKAIPLTMQLSIVYEKLIKIDKTRFISNAEKVHRFIWSNQQQVLDTALIQHFLRFKGTFQIPESELQLNWNESQTHVLKNIKRAQQNGSIPGILNQLKKAFESDEKTQETNSMNLVSFSRQCSSNLIPSHFDKCAAIKDIAANRKYDTKNFNELKSTLQSISSLLKHFSIYIDSSERQQNVKNIGESQTTNKRIAYVSNCSELTSSYLSQNYTQAQIQGILTVLQIAKDVIQDLQFGSSQSFQKSVLTFTLAVYYEISKIDLLETNEFLKSALATINQGLPVVRDSNLVTVFCILSNFYSKNDENMKAVAAFIEQNEQQIVTQIERNKDMNTLFQMSYTAYLCSSELGQHKLCLKILNILSSSSTFQQQEISSNQPLLILALNFLESIQVASKQENSKTPFLTSPSIKLFDEILNRTKINQIELKEMKNGLAHFHPRNTKTLSLTIQWFSQNLRLMPINDVSFFLHRFNRLYMSHIVKNNSVLVADLRQIFLEHHEKNPKLQIVYRRNGLMDESLIESVEASVISRLKSNSMTVTSSINELYNITRLRIAKPELNSLVVSNVLRGSSTSNVIEFTEYVKLLNSLFPADSSQTSVDECLKSKCLILEQINKLISVKKFNLNREPFQQKKLFVYFMYHFKVEASLSKTVEIPTLGSIEGFLKRFNENESNNQKNNGMSNEEFDPSQEILSREELELPQDRKIRSALASLGIPFEKEKRIQNYKIDFFLPDTKHCIELNGDLHYFNENLTPPSETKYTNMRNLGFKVTVVRERSWMNISESEIVEWLKSI